MMNKRILTIHETVARSKEVGMPISEYTLRRAIRCESIPCRVVGRKYLIAWDNVVRWLMCEDGGDHIYANDPAEKPTGEIRPINI